MALAIFKRRRLLTPTDLPEPPSPLALSMNAGHPSALLNIPNELQLMIGSFLTPASLLAFKLTHPHFHHILPNAIDMPGCLDYCSAVAWRTYLENHYPGSRPTSNPRYRCVVCKNVYPASLFEQDCDVGKVGPTELPKRVCAWHRARFTRVFNLGTALTGDLASEAWFSRIDHLCCHCGSIKSWRPCDCDCECGIRDVRIYMRFTENVNECRKYEFVERDGENGKKELWVKEWDSTSSTDDRSNFTTKYVAIKFE